MQVSNNNLFLKRSRELSKRQKDRANALLDKCLQKTIYRNPRHAQNEAYRQQRFNGVVTKSYQCPVCRNWHLTTGGYVD